MTRRPTFNVTYDRESDVLYISRKDVPASRGSLDTHGLVWRYTHDGDVAGVTIMDLHERWHAHPDDLGCVLRNGLSLDPNLGRQIARKALLALTS